jgi:hypothetical protein
MNGSPRVFRKPRGLSREEWIDILCVGMSNPDVLRAQAAEHPNKIPLIQQHYIPGWDEPGAAFTGFAPSYRRGYTDVEWEDDRP